MIWVTAVARVQTQAWELTCAADSAKKKKKIIPTHQSGPFVTTEEPTLTHHYASQSIVYMRVPPWYWTFYRIR